MTTFPNRLPLPEEEIEYPESDGKPMGETEYHVSVIIYLREALRRYFRSKPVYVAADMFLYYERGNPRAVKAPDVMLIKNIAKHSRRTFKTWVEGANPCVVFEITSASTIKEDRGPKREVYAQLGVAEYFLFDPEAEALDPPLEGYRLRQTHYRRITPARDGSLLCRELGLRASVEGRHSLRLRDATTGIPLLTPEEQAEQYEQRAEQERQRADALTEEVARLRAELERRQGPQ